MVETNWHRMGLLVVLWLGYFATHSLLASLWLKERFAAHFPRKMPIYRLGFNCIAVFSLIPVLWLTILDPGPVLWVWRGPLAWLANGLAFAAACGFVASLKHYDIREFIGVRQWKSRGQSVKDQECFHLSPFHRYIRHPWYFFGLVLIWTRDMNSATLVSALMMTVYIIIGSRLEEGKLLIHHGKIYQCYMKRVSGLIPLPWKLLSADEAARLAEEAKDRQRP